jgi:hypothetical protein
VWTSTTPDVPIGARSTCAWALGRKPRPKPLLLTQLATIELPAFAGVPIEFGGKPAQARLAGSPPLKDRLHP